MHNAIASLGRISTRTLLVAFLTLALLAVVARPALANHDFSDVPNTSVHHQSVSKLKQWGVTNGCGGGKYCPGDPVRRDQMATFLDRYDQRVQALIQVIADRLTDVEADVATALEPTHFEKTEVALPVGQTTTVNAECPDGMTATSGGLDISATNAVTEIRHDGPILTNSNTPGEFIATGHRVTVIHRGTSDPGNVAAYVGCESTN